jgi:hypothetical protein
MEDFSSVWPRQNRLQSAPTIELCFIHEFAANCYEFLAESCTRRTYGLKMSWVKQSGSLREVDNLLSKAGRMANPHLPLAAGR